MWYRCPKREEAALPLIAKPAGGTHWRTAHNTGQHRKQKNSKWGCEESWGQRVKVDGLLIQQAGRVGGCVLARRRQHAALLVSR